MPVSPIGRLLRAHRKQRGMSQLDLALLAETSARYVSFVETGRSRPGSGVVTRLAQALSLTPRQTNALLTAAGLLPAFPERELDDDALEPVRRVIERVLHNHAPFPGIVLGPQRRIEMMNAPAERLFPGIRSMSHAQIAATWFPDFDGSADDSLPVVTPTMRFAGTRVRTITTVMRFDRATDMTTSELLVELIFPADEAADAFFRALPA